MIYLENWTGVQVRIFCTWSITRKGTDHGEKSQTATQQGGEGVDGFESAGGQADDQRDHFSASRLRETILVRKDFDGPHVWDKRKTPSQGR